MEAVIIKSKREFARRQRRARMRMRTEAISPGCAAHQHMQRRTAERTGGGQTQLQLSNSRMSRVIFVTGAAVAAAASS